MFISHYWSKFIYKAQRLRVSVPEGAQKSSFFLSLPYRYSLPLLLCSILLHWLLSQSLFVIQTRGFYYSGEEDIDSGFTRAPSLHASVLGYSAIGLVLSLVLLSLLFVVLIFLGLHSLPNRSLHGLIRELDEDIIRMPLASTCSAAISAECCGHDGDEDIHTSAIQWVEVKGGRWAFKRQK